MSIIIPKISSEGEHNKLETGYFNSMVLWAAYVMYIWDLLSEVKIIWKRNLKRILFSMLKIIS